MASYMTPLQNSNPLAEKATPSVKNPTPSEFGNDPPLTGKTTPLTEKTTPGGRSISKLGFLHKKETGFTCLFLFCLECSNKEKSR